MPKAKKTRAKRTKVHDEVETFLQYQEAGRAVGYVQRGRRFRPLSDEQLLGAWRAAFTSLSQSPGDRDRRALSDDLDAEFQLRNMKPPYTSMKDELKRIIDFTVGAFEEIKQGDPERFAEINEEIEADIAAMKRKPKQ